MRTSLPQPSTVGRVVNAVLETARTLGPSIAARSDEIEQLGTLPRDLVDQISPCGAFRQYVPADLGGPGVTAWESLEATEEFAYHDGAVGWCVAIGSTTSLTSSWLPDPWAKELFGDPTSIGGGFAAPNGRATVVEGGLRVSGQWQWGSGTKHCTVIGGGALIVDADGKPAPRDDGLVVPFVFFEPDDVEFIETWDVAGLAGTGSVDYRVTDVFVPDGRWVQFGHSPVVRDNELSRFSFYGMLASGVAAAAVGIARRSIDELIELAAHKKPQGSKRPLAERAPIQAEVAIAEAQLQAAWLLMRDAVERAWESAEAGHPTSTEQRRAIRAAATHATQTSAEVAERMYRAAGGAAVYKTSPIQRCFRDANVATQHAMVAPRMFETIGRMRLGLETNTAML
jgi:alkylation response protein AidB-like acyl-CoA dehydrogenase